VVEGGGGIDKNNIDLGLDEVRDEGEIFFISREGSLHPIMRNTN
jgi:hypothetical protein